MVWYIKCELNVNSAFCTAAVVSGARHTSVNVPVANHRLVFSSSLWEWGAAQHILKIAARLRVEFGFAELWPLIFTLCDLDLRVPRYESWSRPLVSAAQLLQVTFRVSEKKLHHQHHHRSNKQPSANRQTANDATALSWFWIYSMNKQEDRVCVCMCHTFHSFWFLVCCNCCNS